LGIFIGLWVVLAFAFKWYYVRSKKQRSKSWFGENEEKTIYEEMLQKEPDNEDGLRRALVRRCMTDVRRLMKLQEDRDSILSLSRAGAISEEALAEFKRAEKELELELFEVQAEAETFKAGWSQEIVQDAAKLSRMEDGLLETKRAKERDEKRKEEEKARMERERIKAAERSHLDEAEKKKLLEELLEEEERASPASLGKLKKRTSVGGKK
jgi:translocation protein SEC66